MIQEGLECLNEVLRPFLNGVRIPKFKVREDGKYVNYPSEESQEIYLGSAWYAEHWSYDL